jgi:uncharacterized protein involved in outer membrane biogenesis
MTDSHTDSHTDPTVETAAKSPESASNPDFPLPPPEKPRTRGRRRKWLRIFVFLLLFFTVFLATVVYLAYTRLFTGERVKQQIQERISAMIGLPVQVGTLELAFPAITLRGIAVGDPAAAPMPWARLDHISITPDLLRLLTGTIHFESITLASGTLSLARGASGTLILPAQLQATSTAPTAAPLGPQEPPSFPFSSFDLSQLRFQFEDQGLGKTFHVSIPKAGISRSMLSSNLPTVLQMDAGSFGQLDLSGKISWPDRFTGSVTISGTDLSALKGFLPATVEIPSALSSPSLQVTFSAERSGKVEVSHWAITANPGLQASGRLGITSFSPAAGSMAFSLKPVPMKTLLSLAGTHLPEAARHLQFPEGTISMGGDLSFADGALATPSLWVRPEGITITGKPLPAELSGLSLHLKVEGPTISWTDFSCSFAGAALKSKSGAVDWKRDFTGSSDITLDAGLEKLLTAIRPHLPPAAAGIRPTGQISGQGKLRLAGAKSAFTGHLALKNVSLVPPQTGVPIEIPQGQAEFTDFGRDSGTMTIKGFSAETMGAKAKVHGTITSPAAPVFDLSAEGSADLAQLHQKLPIENELFKKKSQLSGQVALSAKLTGTLAKPDLQGEIRLSNAEFAVPDQGLKVANINGNVGIGLDQLRIHSIEALLSGGKITVSGSIRNLTAPTLEIKGDFKKADLHEITSFLARNFSTFPRELEISGKADLNVKIAGKADQPKVEGGADLSGIRFSHPATMRPLTNITGPVQFTNTTMSAQGLKVTWGSSTATITGGVRNFSTFELGFLYNVQPLDLTDIGQFFAGATGYVISGQGTGNGRLTGPLASFTLEGNASIPQGQFEAPISQTNRSTFKFPFTALAAETQLHNGILSVKKASAKLFKGTLNTSGKVYLQETPIRFDFDTKGNQLMAEEFLSLNTTQKQALAGGIDFTLKTAGNTTGLNSLNGRSFLLMKKGRYQSPPLASQIFGLLGANHLTSGAIENLAGNFVFQNGRMNSDDLLINNPLGHVKYRGWVGLDTTLQGTVDLMLTEKACQQSATLRQLAANQKQINLSVGVKGSLLSPSIDLGLEKLLKDALKKQGQQLLQNALSGGAGGKLASGTPSPKDLLQGAKEDLGKLLGGALGGKKPVTPATPPPPPAVSATASPVQPTAAVPAPAPATASPTASPKDKVKKELKKIEKNLKNLFKF